MRFSSAMGSDDVDAVHPVSTYLCRLADGEERRRCSHANWVARRKRPAIPAKKFPASGIHQRHHLHANVTSEDPVRYALRCLNRGFGSRLRGDTGMADITPDFNVCLQRQGSPPAVRREYDVQKINSFLQEAYTILARITDLTRELRSIRPAYLSTAPPARRRQLPDNDPHDRSRPLTEGERDAIDAQSKQLLRQLNAAIDGLKQAEEVRTQTADSVARSKRTRGGLGALGKWAAGGVATAKSPDETLEEQQRNTLSEHRKAVVTFLGLKLGEAGRVQSDMMEVRLSRELEKSKSVLYKSRAAGNIPYTQDDGMPAVTSPSKRRKQSTTTFASSDAQDLEQLSQEQEQLFASENDEMLQHYNTSLSQITAAQKSILEISELQTTIVSNVQMQSESIDQLVEDSYSTTENLGKGNKELKRASERKSTAQGVFYGTVAFCSFLVIWDLIF